MGNSCNICLRDQSSFLNNGELESMPSPKKDLLKSIITIQRAWRKHSISRPPSLYSTQETS